MKRKKKIYNDEVFANIYYLILANSNDNDRVRFLKLQKLDPSVFEQSVNLLCEKVKAQLYEDFKEKLKTS
jgi:hypothetical protein